MFNEFRRLPPVARIFLILMVLSVILGVGLIFALGTQKANKPKPTPSATLVTVPTPSSSIAGNPPPAEYYNTTPSPLPTSFPTDTPTPDHTNIANAGVPGQAVSLGEQDKAYLETREGIIQWCNYSDKETEAAHLKRIQPYFVSGAEQAQSGAYINIIQDQQCTINAGQPQFVLSKTHLRIVVHISSLTIYDGAKTVNGKQQSQLHNSNITYDAYKVGGKWLIGELSTS